MSHEAIRPVDYTNEEGETKTYLIEDVDNNPFRKIIIPPKGEGPRVYREQLTAKIGSKAIDDIFLYRPDPQEVPYESESPIIKMGGLWTIGHHYTKQAIDMAQHGHDFATYIPNFDYPVWRPLLDPKLRKTPYVWHAKNGLHVTRAVLGHTGAAQARVSAHSYGGHTASELLSWQPDLFESAVYEDPSGPTVHELNLKELLENELKPAAQIMNEDDNMLPSNTKLRSIRRITDHGVHAFRELWGLNKIRSEFRVNLKAAREAGVPVGLMTLSRSAIFSASLMRATAEEEGLFDLIDEVDEYHIAPNIRPAAINETERSMFDRLAA